MTVQAGLEKVTQLLPGCLSQDAQPGNLATHGEEEAQATWKVVGVLTGSPI